jgi:hypothetical protein
MSTTSLATPWHEAQFTNYEFGKKEEDVNNQEERYARRARERHGGCYSAAIARRPYEVAPGPRSCC